MDPDVSAPLSCSALTAYGAVKNAHLKPNDNVVIVGGGRTRPDGNTIGKSR